MVPPLTGIRVLDLTQALAGPFGSMILADLGAEVIKVEAPTGDLTRTTPPYYVAGTSVYFLSINRNKRGIVINLKHPRGRDVLYDLVEKSDVVFYNFRPGVADRLGIDHETLSAKNPRIITCDLTGFGQRGPDAQRRAVDLIVQAMAGGMSITGEPGRPPVRAGVPTGDLSAGLYAVVGILAALVARSATGKGMKVETTLYHAQLSLLSYVAAYCLHSGVVPGPVGSAHLGTVPAQVFRTRDSYIAVDAGFNNFFKALCRALGDPSLADDARFRDRESRNRHRQDLIPRLEALFQAKTTAEWVAILDEAGVPAGPVRNVGEALDAAQTHAYAMVRRVDHNGGSAASLATPIWFDEQDDAPPMGAPRLGEHTVEVLSGILGYSDRHIQSLLAEGAIAAADPQ